MLTPAAIASIAVASWRKGLLSDDELAAALKRPYDEARDFMLRLVQGTVEAHDRLIDAIERVKRRLEISEVGGRVELNGKVLGEIQHRYLSFVDPVGQVAKMGLEDLRTKMFLNLVKEGLALIDFKPLSLVYFRARGAQLIEDSLPRYFAKVSVSYDIEVKELKDTLKAAWSGKPKGIVPVTLFFKEGAAVYLGALMGTLARMCGVDLQAATKLLNSRISGRPISTGLLDLVNSTMDEFYSGRCRINLTVTKGYRGLEEQLQPRRKPGRLMDNLIAVLAGAYRLPVRVSEMGEIAPMEAVQLFAKEPLKIGVAEARGSNECISCRREARSSTRKSIPRSKCITQHNLIVSELNECETCRDLADCIPLDVLISVYKVLKYPEPFDLNVYDRSLVNITRVPEGLSRIDYTVHRVACELSERMGSQGLVEYLGELIKYNYVLNDREAGKLTLDEYGIALLTGMYSCLMLTNRFKGAARDEERDVIKALVGSLYRRQNLWEALYAVITKMHGLSMSRLEELRKCYISLRDSKLKELETVYVTSGLLTSLTEEVIGHRAENVRLTEDEEKEIKALRNRGEIKKAEEKEKELRGRKAEEDVVKALRDLIFSGDVAGLKYTIVTKFGYDFPTLRVADFAPWYDRVRERLKEDVEKEEEFTYVAKGETKKGKRIYLRIEVLDKINEAIHREFDPKKVYRDIYHDWASRFPRVFGPR